MDVARAEAGLALCSLGREMMQSGRVFSDITIWVRDDLGELMHARLEFRTCQALWRYLTRHRGARIVSMCEHDDHCQDYR